jgi:type IV pilus assembly protein PilM
MKHVPLFYKQKPIFGIDIGHSTVKVVQVARHKKQPQTIGYGYAEFDPEAIENGVIVDPDAVKKSLRPLLENVVIGELTTDRVVASIPMVYIYSRIVELEDVEEADLSEAIELEAQQYVPLDNDEIYLDYMVLERTEETKTRIFMVAAPKTIVDSYMALFTDLRLEVYGMEPSLLSIIRAINHTNEGETPKIAIDFGSQSSDLAIYDQSLRLTSTASAGGDHITECIMETLQVDREEAQRIKTRYGISKSEWQEQLAPALTPILTTLANEVQKMLRYHHERNDTEADIEQVVIVGGGANLPGLDNFISRLTGIPVSTSDPWENLNVKPLQPPHRLETTLYTTAVGLALRELQR